MAAAVLDGAVLRLPGGGRKAIGCGRLYVVRHGKPVNLRGAGGMEHGGAGGECGAGGADIVHQHQAPSPSKAARGEGEGALEVASTLFRGEADLRGRIPDPSKEQVYREAAPA